MSYMHDEMKRIAEKIAESDRQRQRWFWAIFLMRFAPIAVFAALAVTIIQALRLLLDKGYL